MSDREVRVAAAVVAACIAVSVVSLALPLAPAYDPWAWLVWGREVLHLDLDTTGGPSWKPLPVVVTTPLAALGDLAPGAWLVVARTVGLLAVVGLFRLGARLGGALAGAAAALLLLTTPDPGSRFLRLVGEGHADVWVVTFGVWAVERHLAGRPRQALALATAAALVRPEVWPFLLAYAAWRWWRAPEDRRVVTALLLVVPLLWFGGDLWGSGDPWHGADTARVADAGIGDRFRTAMEALVEVVALPVWIAAAAGVVAGWRRGTRILATLAAAATGWGALVVAMATLLRYAALGRFFLPVAAAACALAGIGVAWALDAVGSAGARTAVAIGIVAAAAPFVGPRVTVLDALADEARGRDRIHADLAEAVDRLGRDGALACGDVSVESTGLAGISRPALAWELDVPLHQVERRLRVGEHGVSFVLRDGAQDAALRQRADRVVPVVATATWRGYAVACPAAEAHTAR